MKLGIYTIAAILVAGLAVGVSFSYTPSVENESKISAGREVYVNVTQLTKLHPSYAALSEMRATLANVQAGSSRVMAQYRPEVQAKSVVKNASGTMNRNNLIAAVAKSAMADLYMLESDQREALRARLRDKREIMKEDAEAEIKLQVSEIEEAAAKSIRSVAQSRVTDRLNAQIRTFALRSAAKSMGVDQQIANTNLDKAREELSRIDSERLTLENALNANARARISELRVSAEKDIDSKLSMYETEENRRIDDSVVAPHEQAVREMKPFDGFANHAKTASVNRTSTAVRMPKYPAIDKSDTAFTVLEKKSFEIETRIKKDVVRAVQKLAREKGVKVFFTQGGQNLPDETQMFSSLMRECAWGICEPVLTGMRGS